VICTVGGGQRETTVLSQTHIRYETNYSRTIRYKTRDSEGIFKVRLTCRMWPPVTIWELSVILAFTYSTFEMYLMQCICNPCCSSPNNYGYVLRKNRMKDSVISSMSSGKYEVPLNCSAVL
jgi:hypothetical protein